MVGSYGDLGLRDRGYLQRPPRPLMDVFSHIEARDHLLKFSGVIPMYQLLLRISENFALWSSLHCLNHKELTQMVLTVPRTMWMHTVPWIMSFISIFVRELVVWHLPVKESGQVTRVEVPSGECWSQSRQS